MRIENFGPRAHKRTAALIVLRLRPAERAQASALVGALVGAGIVPETPTIEHLDYPVEVLAVPWRPPKPREADAHRSALEEIGARFDVETAWCVQSTAWAPKVSDKPAKASKNTRNKKLTAIVPVWKPEQGPLPFPVDGYPDILDEGLDWYDYGIAVKLGGPTLAGEEQVLDAFSLLWCQSFRKFRHVGMEYDGTRRAAVIWIDRWTFARSDQDPVHHTLWLAARIHDVLPIRHASFQGAEIDWKYRSLTGDDSEPFILAGNPLLAVYRARGEEGVATWTADPPPAWSPAEIAAMLVALVEEHPPGDPATTPTALRLAQRAIDLDPDQDQARADIITLLVHSGQLDKAVQRVDGWGRPDLSTFLVEAVAKHAPQRLAEVIGRVPTRPANVAALEAYGLGPQRLPAAVWIDLATRETETSDGPDALLADLVANLATQAATTVVVAVARHAPERLRPFLRALPPDEDAANYLYPASFQVLRTPNSTDPRDATPESLAICERVMELPDPADASDGPGTHQDWYTWAHAAAISWAHSLGDLDRATEHIDRSLHLADANPAIYFNAACVYTGGRHDAARGLELLRLAVRAGFRDVEAISTDDDLVVLHDDPEFQAILAEAGQRPPES